MKGGEKVRCRVMIYVFFFLKRLLYLSVASSHFVSVRITPISQVGSTNLSGEHVPVPDDAIFWRELATIMMNARFCWFYSIRNVFLGLGIKHLKQ